VRVGSGCEVSAGKNRIRKLLTNGSTCLKGPEAVSTKPCEDMPLKQCEPDGCRRDPPSMNLSPHVQAYRVAGHEAPDAGSLYAATLRDRRPAKRGW